MNWLFEDSTPVIVIGVLAEIVLGVVLFRTGLLKWLYWMVGVLIVVAGLVCVEKLTVTDRKLVRATLREAAAAVEHNDPAAAKACLAPDAAELRTLIDSMAARLKVNEARIGRDLEITVNRYTSPPQAIAKFTGSIDADFNGIHVAMPRAIEVTLHEVNHRWLLYSFKMNESDTKWLKGVGVGQGLP